MFIFFFNKFFYKKKLSHLGHNGISEFIMAVKKNCKNPVNGIMLPFNFGNEVFLCKQNMSENISKIFRNYC